MTVYIGFDNDYKETNGWKINYVGIKGYFKQRAGIDMLMMSEDRFELKIQKYIESNDERKDWNRDQNHYVSDIQINHWLGGK